MFLPETEVFARLCQAFSTLSVTRRGDSDSVHQILKDLNKLNYNTCMGNYTVRAALLINQLCSYVPFGYGEEKLIEESCALINSMMSTKKVKLESRTLIVTVKWCLEILNQDLSIESYVNTLMALDALLRNNPQYAPDHLIELADSDGIVMKLIRSHGLPGGIRSLETLSTSVLRYALQCLESCTIVQENSNRDLYPQFHACASLFMKCICLTPKFECHDYLKMLSACFQGLDNICAQNDKILNENLPLILGICRSYIFLYCIKGLQIPPKALLPSALSIQEPPASQIRENKGGKLIKLRKQKITKKEELKKCDELMNLLDQDTTDASERFPESGPPMKEVELLDCDVSDRAICLLTSKVRVGAFSLLFTAAKNVEKGVMFQYWSYFVSENALSGKHYLMTCAIEDHFPACRSLALNILLYLINSWKPYLSQAEASNVKMTSFTSFSVVLGYMLENLHTQLRFALSESIMSILAQNLKCLAALVQATPYYRLKPGLISQIVRNMVHFVRHRELTIKVGALIVLGCVLASEPTVPETKMLFAAHKVGSERYETRGTATNDDSEEDFRFVELPRNEQQGEGAAPIWRPPKNDFKHMAGIPWIVQLCLQLLGVIVQDKRKTIFPAPLKLEVLHLISSMCRNYFDCLVYPHLGQFARGLSDCLSDTINDLRLHAGRTIDFIGQSLEQHLENLSESGQIEHDQLSTGLLFWQTLLNGPLIELLQSEQQVAAVKAVGCDCIGSIGSHVFEKLSREKQILCITLLFGCFRDEENSVKSAAIRSLGILVLYPNLREDSGFVVDTAEAAMTAIQNGNLGVKVKGSWALGNLSDALVLNRSNADIEELPNSVLFKLFDISIQYSAGNDRIKMNVVRTLGNLLSLITADLLADDKFKNIAHEAIDRLILTATTGLNMKVRWNACYAIGKLLKNDALFSHSSAWLNHVFGALNELVISFKNFKVRINAALALSSPSKREYYGTNYQNTWTSLLKALENSLNVDDYLEYQHRDHLIEQICISLGYLITLLEADDLDPLNGSLMTHIDVFKTQMKRINEILPPEKSSILVSALEHLNSFDNLKLSSKATETLTILKNALSENS